MDPHDTPSGISVQLKLGTATVVISLLSGASDTLMGRSATIFTVIATAIVTAQNSDPLVGPYAVERTTVDVPGLWLNEGTTDVYYATNSTTELRFVTFMHGAGGGLIIQPFVYHSFLNALASWGFVIASPRVCLDGDCLDTYINQAPIVIDWAAEQAAAGHPIFSLANFSLGVGLSGHSMGGGATLAGSQEEVASKHNIVAAVMLHPYTANLQQDTANTQKAPTWYEDPPSIPFLAFTGDTDTTADMGMSEAFYNASSAELPRGIVEKTGEYATHQEPSNWHNWNEPYNPYLAQFVAGWFKLYLKSADVGSDGVQSWDDLIFGDGPESLCGGGDGEMVWCRTERGGSS